MKTLFAKEIRLMLPVYGLALLLAVVPVWLLPNHLASTFNVFSLYPFCFGVVLLALASFGREFGLNTFQALLAQPLERATLWRAKIIVLGAATATVFSAWCLCSMAPIRFVLHGGVDPNSGFYASGFYQDLPREMYVGPGIFVSGGIMVLAMFSGGLWTTLLLRQVTAPFWFTILLPATIAMVISVFGGGYALIVAALVIYSIAGFLLARKLFQHAEETAWTGGTIVLPHWKTADDAVRSEIRWRRPWAAIMRKEFQLHQIGLAGMGVLFAVHLGTLAFHHGGANDKVAGAVRSVSDLCSLLWCVAPLFMGATSVAEERKLGTMEAHLCLPVSSRVQFVFKLLFVVLLGGVLSAALLWTKVCIGHLIFGPADFAELKIGSNFASLLGLSCLFSAMALIAFYASTLTRNIMQALATSVVTVIAVWILMAMAVPQSGFLPYGPFTRLLYEFLPWRGLLVYLIGLPALILAFTWLSYRNYRRLSETWRLWRRNLVGLVGTVLFISTATAALYNRAWEFLTPLEPAHGTARLAGNREVSLRSEYLGGGSMGFLLAFLQPDGRFWEGGLINQRGWNDNFAGQRVVLPFGGHWNSLKGNHYVGGSNWMGVAVLNHDTAAIRSDGTLWVSEKPHPVIVTNGTLLTDRPEPLIQFGNETNWKSLIPIGGTGVLLLKTDGTLWLWEAWNFNWRNPWPGMLAFQPHRLGTASDWADIASARGGHENGKPWIFAWKKTGQAWALTEPFNASSANQRFNVVLEPGVGLAREESFDNLKWRSLIEWSPQWRPYHAGVREDGTLWILDLQQHQKSPSRAQITGRNKQVGHDTNWVEVASGQGSLVALKADGTLWRWDGALELWNGRVDQPATEPPVQVGSHDDWVAVSGTDNGIVSLAADGSLWFWWGREADYYYMRTRLLASSRKPVKLGNIFGQE